MSKRQSEKFKALARESGCDENEAAFDKTLKKIASPTASPPPKEVKPKPKKRKPAK